MFFNRLNGKCQISAFSNTQALHDRPLNPQTARELKLIEELRGRFLQLPDSQQSDPESCHDVWIAKMACLKDLVLTQDPRAFLSWNVIVDTMFVTQQDYISIELDYLTRLPDWTTRWRSAIQESSVGQPAPYKHYPASSENLIHHAYHLARFENQTGMRVSDTRFIFEFGAGYGSMCRLAHKLGFQGRYSLFDLAPFSALQTFFLKSIGFEPHSFQSFKTARSGVACLSDIEELKEILAACPASADPLFIATWSISETQVQFRDSILSLLSSFKALLIAYQAQFREINNVDFFKQWTANWNNAGWQDREIEHMPTSRYLFAKAN